MLRVDPSNRSLVPVKSTTLTQSNILERADLQAAILKSWSSFCSELGYEELFLVGSEIEPHESCRDRIDILALTREGTPVVFELKRHRDRLQLLQALSYAAMVARWNAARFLQHLRSRNDEETEEIRILLSHEDFRFASPEVVLIAESFDPEVILTADWLASFGVSITAFSISGVEHRGDTLITIDQKFPVAGIDEVYVSRGRRAAAEAGATSWEEALKDVSFPFARRAVEIFRRRIEGSPHRRAFNSIYSSSPLGRMTIAVRKRYLKIYTQDRSEEAELILRELLTPEITLESWGSETTKNSGFTFTIETEEQLEKFLRAVGETGA